MNDDRTTCSSSPSPPWIELPKDVTANILRRLSPDEILKTAERVCTTWRSICREPSFWRVFNIKCSGGLHARNKADKLLRLAVDRSQGQLIDINIRYFGTDDLLRYVSARLSNLKILSLKSTCSCISSQGLTTALKNIPNLEELHLFDMPWIGGHDIKTIGISCPMIRSFTFYINRDLGFTWYGLSTHNSTALSIAKSMPNLARLCLFGNLLGNKGLLAILDGCPKLESLDLRECFNVDLQCDLGRRCSEQIKVLRCDHPFYDPEVEDAYTFDDGRDDDIYDHMSEDASDDYRDEHVCNPMGEDEIFISFLFA